MIMRALLLLPTFWIFFVVAAAVQRTWVLSLADFFDRTLDLKTRLEMPFSRISLRFSVGCICQEL